MDTQIVAAAERYVRELFAQEYSGHDFWHTFRVMRMAERIAREEGADLLTVQLAALLHDVDDRKLSPETSRNLRRAREFLMSQGAGEALTERIVTIIRQVSFLGTDSVIPTTVEGRCVQDADRLDAIGAIGVARAFAFGGSHHRLMHDPAILPRECMDAAAYCASESTTVNHFYEKLLLLEDMMTTDAGKRIAKERGKYLRDFLDEFLAEWDGVR